MNTSGNTAMALPKARHAVCCNQHGRTVPAQAFTHLNTILAEAGWAGAEGSAVVQLHGRDWGHLAAAVPSKTLTQIKNYYQNYKVKVRSRY